VLTGCKNKPKKAKGPDLVTEAWIKKNIGVDGAATEVSEADAQKALEFLELDAPGEKVSWEARTGSNGNYVYKNITSTEDNFTVDSLTIKGLRMLDDETPVADSFEVTNQLEGRH